MNDNISEKAREARVRRSLQRQGFVLRKSRCRTPESPNWCNFHIADFNGLGVAGTHPWAYSMSLEDVEAFAAEEAS